MMALQGISWDRPTYLGHDYTEIWRSNAQLSDSETSTVESNATKIGEASANAFNDTDVSRGSTYYYYIRHVNTDGVKSAFIELEAAVESLPNAGSLGLDSDDNVTFNSVTANVVFSGSMEVTVVDNSISVTYPGFYLIDTGGTAVDITSINNGEIGVYYFKSKTTNDNPTFKDGSTLKLDGDVTLGDGLDVVTLLYSGSDWYQIAYSNN